MMDQIDDGDVSVCVGFGLGRDRNDEGTIRERDPTRYNIFIEMLTKL